MHLTSSAQERLCDQRSGLHCEINTRKRPRVCTPKANADILRLHHTSVKMNGELPAPSCWTASHKKKRRACARRHFWTAEKSRCVNRGPKSLVLFVRPVVARL